MILSSLNIEDLNESGAELVIYHPISYEPTDIKLIVHGFNSRAYKKASRELSKYKAKESHNPEFTALHFIVATMIKSWENVESENGQIEFSVDNAIELFNTSPFVFAQVEAFIENRSNFFLQK